MPAMRIIINIPEPEGFSWNTAFELWKQNMPTENGGFNHTPTYAWHKINPLTGIPYPLSENANDIFQAMPQKLMRFGQSTQTPVDQLTLSMAKVQIDELKEQIDALASAVYKMKQEMKKGKTPDTQTISALENTARTSYSRWSQLDRDAERTIAESTKPKTKKRAKASPTMQDADAFSARHLFAAFGGEHA